MDPMPGYVRGFAIADWSEGLEGALMDLAGPGRSNAFVKVELRHLGGAIERAPEGGNAIGQREARFVACYVAATPAPGMMEAAKAEAQRFADTFAPFTGMGPCMNFVHERAELDAALPAASLARLRAIKLQHDPANLFRFPGFLSDAVAGEIRSVA
jgi:hypothetical protein